MAAREASVLVFVGALVSAACDAPAAPYGARRESEEVAGKGVAGKAATAPNDADRFLGRDRTQTFERIRRAIESFEVISVPGLARLGLRWDDGSAFADARARFQAASTTDDVYYALLSLQHSIHDGHSRLELGSSPGALRAPSASVALPLEVVAEYEAGAPRYIVASEGPNKGARVVTVDGKPIESFERELVPWVLGSSPERWRLSVARWLTRRKADELPAPAAGTRTQLGLTAADGTSRKLDLEWQAAAPRSPSTGDACTNAVPLNPDYASQTPVHKGEFLCVYPGRVRGSEIVRWFGFDYQEDAGFRRDYEAMLDHASNAGTTKLLFDVRENGGGAFDATVVSAFTSSPVQQLGVEVFFGSGLKQDPRLLDAAEAGPQAALAKAFLLANPTATKSPRFPFFCPTSACGEAEMTLPRPESPMVADVAILTGPGCFSACDNFVAMMKDAGVARLVGMPSSAADSPVRVPVPITLEDGATTITLVLTVAVNRRSNGAILEGTPDAPSVPVFPSAANRGRYLDAVLVATGF